MRQLLAAALLLCRHDAATALRLPSALKQQHTRSEFLKLAAVTAGTAAWSTCLPAWSLDLDDDEDLNDNDEIPDVRMRQPAKSKAKPVADAAAGKAAYAQLVAARRALDDFSTDNLAPYEGLEQALLVLVNSPVLRKEDKLAIGTIKRYGVGADVLIMVGGLTAAAQTKDANGVRDYTKKAAAALDEVILIGKANKL